MFLFLIFPIFLFIIWLIFIANERSMKKNGVVVMASVKGIEEERNSNGYLTSITTLVEFEYNGTQQKKLYDLKNIPINGTVKCWYDTKYDKLVEYYNRKNNYHLLLLSISIFLFAFYFIFKKLFNSPFDNNVVVDTLMNASDGNNLSFLLVIIPVLIIPITLFIVGFIINNKNKHILDNYQKINAKVKDIFTRSKLDSDKVLLDLYTPVLNYNYNNYDYTYICSSYSTNINFKIGDSIEIFYDTKNDIAYDYFVKSKIGLVLIIISIILFIIVTLSMFI